jgi:uncharacterized membrane protein YbhN (UPF0104 family)
VLPRLGSSPALGVLVLGYLIGQLGGNLSIPRGLGGLDGGLIGTFVLYHQPLAPTTAAVLVYHAISLLDPWAAWQRRSFKLRNTLVRAGQLAALCMPLAEPIEAVALPATSGGSG